MIIRLRSRDGLERLEIGENATVRELIRQIGEKLDIPDEGIVLSTNPNLLIAKSDHESSFKDLQPPSAPLKSLGIAHGSMIFMHYPYEREVQSTVKKSVFESRAFGEKMTMDGLISTFTRIERQDTPHCASVSFDRHAANMFQQYVSGALRFGIKRGGLLYGTVDDEGNVLVEAVYEPPQEGSTDSLYLERGTEEEKRADYLAKLLGLQKVGWIFTQSSKERDFILSTEEVVQISHMQEELGDTAVTAVVSLEVDEDNNPDVHFEAFQVSDQCVRLVKDGWFANATANTTGVTVMQNPKDPKRKDPVILAGKDAGEVDNDYFLIPVKILDHEGPLKTTFPIENRLLPQGKAELKQHLQKAKGGGKPLQEALADFHVLLYLSKQANFDLGSDMAILCDAVANKYAIPEGYAIIIDSLAGL